ncbi:FadR/GntR family transcriptional regulator [Specibacter cremeus]|uniref:FadR/GntR family transcriptional regulator n=1 Tax=Specibacter cremeus TaxID=1629051 RepID=UPI001F0CCDE6|nr:FCD domain-containing protein [Specibacter cremeus]
MKQQMLDSRYPVLGPLRHGNAFEETIGRILQSIKLGMFGSGDKLPPERELSDLLGVSRSTLRDALAELQTAGYIEVRRGRYGGTYVSRNRPANPRELRPLDSAEVEDVLIFRRVVEPAAASLAARASLTAGARSHLLATLADVSNAPAELYRPKDARFHVAIAELSGSPTLTSAVAAARARVSDLLDRIPLLAPNLQHSNEQHQQIVDAILRGDADGAARVALDHLDGTAALLRGFLGTSTDE